MRGAGGGDRSESVEGGAGGVGVARSREMGFRQGRNERGVTLGDLSPKPPEFGLVGRVHYGLG